MESRTDLEDRLSKLSVIIVTHVFAMGQAQELKKFLLGKTRKLAFIGHPFTFSKEKRSFIEIYEHDRLKLKLKAPQIVGPQILVYLKDVFFTFFFIFKVKNRFDIYYGANCLNAFLGILLKKLRFVRVVIFNTVDYTPYRFQNKILNGIYHCLDKISCYYCDFVWNLSPAMAEARWRRGISKKRSAPQLTVPIGCDFDRIKRLPFGKMNGYRIAYAGYLGESKGIGLLLEALPEILKEVPQTELIIIGRGPLENKLKRRSKELRIEKNVEFKGFLDNHTDVEKTLATCAVGVAPYNPNPNSYTWFADPAKPKQYMACGLPVIITKVPIIACEIEKRKAGIVVDYEQSELVNALVKLPKNDELYKELRENAIRFASEFKWEHIFSEAFRRMFRCLDRQKTSCMRRCQLG